MREARPGGLGVRVCERRGARVVPGGILLATRGELRQVGDAGAPEVMAVPGFLREAPRQRRLLRDIPRGKRDETRDGEPDEGGGASRGGLRDQQADGEQQRQPGAWPALLRAGLARPCPTIRGDEVANRAGLVGE